MKLIINIYRVYDADLYALNMTVGRKMFGELLVAALKGYAAGTKPGITFGEISIPNQAEGVNKRVIHIQKTIKDGTPEADMLSSIQPRLTGLFVKNLLRWYYFGSFQPFYFAECTEDAVSERAIIRPASPAVPAPRVHRAPSLSSTRKENKEEKIEKSKKIEKSVDEAQPTTVKTVSKAIEEVKPIEDIRKDPPIEQITPKSAVVETPAEAPAETATPIEEESDNSGLEDLMSLFSGINVT